MKGLISLFFFFFFLVQLFMFITSSSIFFRNYHDGNCCFATRILYIAFNLPLRFHNLGNPQDEAVVKADEARCANFATWHCKSNYISQFHNVCSLVFIAVDIGALTNLAFAVGF